ncbi:MAG: thermonuclease family protein [Candidatus Poribacteria bacterium]|nr:thermonuclease family protein [Candidatus Poribacteria bacterium]
MQSPNLRTFLYAILFGSLLVILGTGMMYGVLYVWGDAQQWECIIIDPEKQVYDGVTIKDVRVKVLDHAFASEETGLKWPGIIIDDDGVYVFTDIRIAGIDTPKKSASTKNVDGTPRSEASREREKVAALAARQTLIDIITNNSNKISLTDVHQGTDAGITIADIAVSEMDVASLLIQYGHAKSYDGGAKPTWNWGK